MQLSPNELVQSLIGFWAGNRNSDHLLKQLSKAERSHPVAEIAASLFFEVVPTAALYSKAIAHVMNFYLHDGRKEAREDIARLSALHTPEADAKVQGYVHEALSKCISPYGIYC
jgi:linoleate 10R-lipoxygenase